MSVLFAICEKACCNSNALGKTTKESMSRVRWMFPSTCRQFDSLRAF